MTHKGFSGGDNPRGKANRELIMRHPDLAEKLRKLYGIHESLPLESWSGFVPPALTEHGSINNSPYRAGLVALLAEARRREEHERNT